MAVYKRTYKVYDGPLTPSGSRFFVLTRFALGALFKSRIFTVFNVICLVPFLVGIAIIYLLHSQIAQYLLDVRLGRFEISGEWFEIMLAIQAGLGFIVVAWSAPGLVSKDFANQGLQLYFSRPLSRTEYILGKISVLVLLLSALTWVPVLLLFGLQAQLEGHGWGFSHLYIAGAIFVSSLLWIAVISLMGLALSVFVRWRIASTAIIIAVLFVLPGFGQMINAILQTRWGNLLNISYLMMVTWSDLFRLDPTSRGRLELDQTPLWSAWAAIFAICIISVMLLNRRLKAREVVRG